MKRELSLRESEYLQRIRIHQNDVADFLLRAAHEIVNRAASHDDSKMRSPEKEYFSIPDDNLRSLSYGSEKYFSALEERESIVAPAKYHHFMTNRHHPEHFENGINDMNLIDLIEMVADWKSASKNHKNNSLGKMIEINSKKFGIDAQLSMILYNTIKLFSRD